jgi:hypothetical protein
MRISIWKPKAGQDFLARGLHRHSLGWDISLLIFGFNIIIFHRNRKLKRLKLNEKD